MLQRRTNACLPLDETLSGNFSHHQAQMVIVSSLRHANGWDAPRPTRSHVNQTTIYLIGASSTDSPLTRIDFNALIDALRMPSGSGAYPSRLAAP
jgi:hypothetical protein